MGILKIRAVRSTSEERESRYAVIDTFEDVKGDYVYNCSSELFNIGGYEGGKSKRGREIQYPEVRLKDEIGAISACDDDVFEYLDIPMYLGFSRALKRNGYVFNKKLARLYKK